MTQREHWHVWFWEAIESAKKRYVVTRAERLRGGRWSMAWDVEPIDATDATFTSILRSLGAIAKLPSSRTTEAEARTDCEVFRALRPELIYRVSRGQPRKTPLELGVGVLPPERCHAGKDRDCLEKTCPQLRDGEPAKSGRHCPLDTRPLEDFGV